jgi:hypothetical protein
MVGRPTTTTSNKNRALALARQVRLETRRGPLAAIPPPIPTPSNVDNHDADDESSGDDIECTGWSGGVVHYISSDEEPIVVSDGESEDSEVVEELSGSKLEEAIQQHSKRVPATAKPNTFPVIMNLRTNQEWKKAENIRSLGYNGRSTRTKRYQEKAARDKEKGDATLRSG